MEGYRLRSRSVPPDTRSPDSVPPPRPTDASCPPEGPVDESGPVGHSFGFMAAEQSEAGYPLTDTQLETASAGLSGATTLRARLLMGSPRHQCPRRHGSGPGSGGLRKCQGLRRTDDTARTKLHVISRTRVCVR